jgi:hypothetical protein
MAALPRIFCCDLEFFIPKVLAWTFPWNKSVDNDNLKIIGFSPQFKPILAWSCSQEVPLGHPFGKSPI